MIVKNAVICAAGLGSRLGYNIPKCLVDIGEHKLIYYLLKALKDVENVRIVVGFKENEVIEYVKQIRNDVVFVRNPDYKSTSNSYSLYQGSYDLKESFLTIDGDMIVDVNSLNSFFESYEAGQNLIGITKAKTEDAVFVIMDDDMNVTGFTRENKTDWEWSGIAYLQNNIIRSDGRYVFEDLIPHLPMKGKEISCFEIDTPDDLLLMRNNLHKINIGI